MNVQLRRWSRVWTLFCGLILSLAFAANYVDSRGESPLEIQNALPAPVDVPVPDAVFHTDNYGNSMAIDGDTLVVGAPWTNVNGVEQQGVAYIFTRDSADPQHFTLLKSI